MVMRGLIEAEGDKSPALRRKNSGALPRTPPGPRAPVPVI
jgi:hypothetical protein